MPQFYSMHNISGIMPAISNRFLECCSKPSA